jgi:hypothetical protein
MTKQMILQDDGNPGPAASPAGTATYGNVGVGGGNFEDDSGRQDEVDEGDDEWSPVAGRSWDVDVRASSVGTELQSGLIPS